MNVLGDERCLAAFREITAADKVQKGQWVRKISLQNSSYAMSDDKHLPELETKGVCES